MTCRHEKGDPNCSSHPTRVEEARALLEAENKRNGDSPDSANFEILDMVRCDRHIVLKVRYPNCASCAYEGTKVMVFNTVSEIDVLRWRKIDPHFRDPKAPRTAREAPPPVARFPASPEGWADALQYAERSKGHVR